MQKGDIVKPTHDTLEKYSTTETDASLVVLDTLLCQVAYCKHKVEFVILQSTQTGKKYCSEAFHFQKINNEKNKASALQPTENQ